MNEQNNLNTVPNAQPAPAPAAQPSPVAAPAPAPAPAPVAQPSPVAAPAPAPAPQQSQAAIGAQPPKRERTDFWSFGSYPAGGQQT